MITDQGRRETVPARSTSRPSSFLESALRDFLDADTKPTFVLDIRGFNQPQLRPVYVNRAFNTSEHLSPDLFGADSHDPKSHARDSGFYDWVIGTAGADSYDFAAHRWHRFDIHQSWRVLRSLGPTAVLNASALHSDSSPATRARASGSKKSSPITRSLDWTDKQLAPVLSEHVKLFRDHDWGSTVMGPMHQWSPQLRNMLNMVMASPSAAAVLWGEDLISFYNEEYSKILANKHPSVIGQGMQDVWPEVWEQLEPIVDKVFYAAEAIRQEDILFILDRGDCLEETYFTFTMVPLIGNDGKVCGIYNEASEVTRRVMYQRRMDMLMDMNRFTAASKSLDDYWQSVLMAMEPATVDVPFAILYSLESDSDDDESTHPSQKSNNTTGNRICRLEGAVGVPTLKLEINFERDDHTIVLARLFQKATAAEGCIVLGADDDGWPQALMNEQDPSRGFGDRCKQATVYALRPSASAGIRGFLIIGLNARQPNNDDLALFREMLGRHITSSLASTLLFEVELRRYQRRVQEAVTDRAAMTKELLQRARDTEILESRFFRVAEQAAVGIFILNRDGSIIYCNDKWYEFTGVSKDNMDPVPWSDSVWAEDSELVDTEWNKVAVDNIPVHFEMRFKRVSYESEEGRQADGPEAAPFYWILASAYPDMAEDGTPLSSVTGVITDISHQKWAENEHQRRALEALEAKRQQENFVDMVSHEIRNPLNAILQCADTIVTSSRDFETTDDRSGVKTSILEAAETIVYCSDHQKRIVDDILTMSKLDSDLLTVALVPVRPVQLLQHSVKMFYTQSQNAQVDLSLDLDDSLATFGIDWVLLDPNRVLQIIINLLTNAIKFTSSDQGIQGRVTVGLSASVVKPVVSSHDIHYFPPRRPQAKSISNNSNSTEDQIFLSFYIRDTGHGLTEDEQRHLFNRFAQASPRTHIQYGGSGLGLYISRQLAELQGGQIGMSSRTGEGSVFAFYVESKRSQPPDLSNDPSSTDTDADLGRRFQDWLASSSILIVEDNLINQKILQKKLTPLVRETHVANNGTEALDFVRSSKSWKGNKDGKLVTVILMDVEMPIMDGLACTREIRRLEMDGFISDRLMIVAITANARLEQVNTAKEAGMDEVLPKPFLIKDLKEALRRVYLSSRNQRPRQTG